MTPAPLPEEDHHCESCGLRYGDLTPSAALRLIRTYPTQYRHRLQHLPADLLRRRPAAGVWSPLEYACHVRDVYAVYDTRIRRTLTEHEPCLSRCATTIAPSAMPTTVSRCPPFCRLSNVTLTGSPPSRVRSANGSGAAQPSGSLANAVPSYGWCGKPRMKGCITCTTSAWALPTGQCCSTSTACSSIHTRVPPDLEPWATHRNLDPDLVWSDTHGRRPIDTITVVAPQLDADAEYRLVRDMMAQEGDAFPVYPDAAAVLSLMKGQPWGVVTSGRTPTVLQRLRAGRPDPPVLVDSSQVGRGKPDPEGYLRAAQLLDVTASDCLVIEDAPTGVEAARTAGMTVIAVRTTHPGDELAGAHHRVDTFSDTIPLIADWLDSTHP